MGSEQFKVKRVRSESPGKGTGHLHEVQTSASVAITVDVDEEGYLRHESSMSHGSGSGSDVSDLSNEDKAVAEGGITFAIQRALKPHRAAADAITIIWTEEGSIIVGIELDLPCALHLPSLSLLPCG